MNFLTIFIETLFGFVRRNPITCLIIVVLAVAFPPLLGFILGAVVVLILLAVLSALVLLWRLRSVKRTMEQQLHDAAQRNGGYYDNGQQSRTEGDVSVHRTSSAPEKKINDDVGEYVDFEEEGENQENFN